jgi:Pyruvate/2-oxoacid:ferredoxin oxidoreductase delta subunit
MRALLFYFSGTGNSLKVARDLSWRLDRAVLHPMASGPPRGHSSENEEVVGLVFPLYFLGLPLIVEDFVRRFSIRGRPYLFAVVTRGGTPGCALFQLKNLLKAKGKSLDAGFYVTMGTNFIPRYRASSGTRLGSRLRKAEAAVERIAGIVRNRRIRTFCDFPLLRRAFLAYYRWSMSSLHARDRNFFSDERCDSCGVCERICPVDNIRLFNGKPHWGGNCQLCLACLHFCPDAAIQYGNRTNGKPRYHNPAIGAGDIVAQKPGGCARRPPSVPTMPEGGSSSDPRT